MLSTMCPACGWATHSKFFHKVSSDVSIMSPGGTFWSNHNVITILFNFTMYSQRNHHVYGCTHSGHITGYFVKEVWMSGSGTCWTHCGQHCERNHHVLSWVHCEHIAEHFVKEFKMCPLGTLRSHWWVHCDCNQNVPTGHIEITLLSTLWSQSKCAQWAHWIHMAWHILNVFKFSPLGTLWSLVDCNLNVFSMYPLGICPLVPSVITLLVSPEICPRMSSVLVYN